MVGRENILKVLDRADEVDREEGKVAYPRYNEVLGEIAGLYGYPLPAVIACFAALSPNNDYVGNLRSAVSVLVGHRAGVPVQEIKVSTYNHCRDRAYTYLSGVSFLDTVVGKKIRSFYLNILDPLDPEPVTIDGHAINIWRGERLPLKTVAHGTTRYEIVATDFRAVAQEAGLLPNQLQAITWFTWKRVHRIIYGGRQLELFTDRSGDFWRTLRRPEDIKPYT